MRTLILGGGGFIGKNLVRELSTNSQREITVIDSFVNSDESYFRKLFPDVKLINADIAMIKDFNDIVLAINPKEIYHLAANSDIRISSIDPIHDVKNTFMTTARLVKVLPSLSNPSVFFASSSAVYGPKDEAVFESATPNPISSYGWMKYTSEVILNDAMELGQIQKLVIFRFPNVVGEFMTHGVIFDLINKLQANPSELEVLGDGTQEKPYVLASNLARMISQSLSNQFFDSGTYNISASDRSKVSEIVETICRVTELSPKINYGTSRNGWKGDVAEYELRTDKIKSTVMSTSFDLSAHAIETAVRFYWQEVNDH